MFGFFEGPAFNPQDIPSLSGKVIIITGANGGLGYETLLNLAPHHPSKIYLCARSRAKYDTAMQGITAAVPDAASFVHYLELDLTSLASVKSAAQSFLGDNDRLDILMNNAGIMAVPPGLTQDGYEIQFGTNHLGHFLLTRELLPLLHATAQLPGADVRILNLSSAGHALPPRSTGFVPAACTTTMADYSTWTRYGQSKLANVLFSAQLAQRYPDVTSVSIHPGTVATGLANSFMGDHSLLTKVLLPFKGWITTDPASGALNQTWACVAPVKGREGSGTESGSGSGIKGQLESGRYYVPVGKAVTPSAFARDEKLARELWEWSEKELKGKGY